PAEADEPKPVASPAPNATALDEVSAPATCPGGAPAATAARSMVSGATPALRAALTTAFTFPPARMTAWIAASGLAPDTRSAVVSAPALTPAAKAACAMSAADLPAAIWDFTAASKPAPLMPLLNCAHAEKDVKANVASRMLA